MTDVVRYDAAGGVVLDSDMVLVLLRPARSEVRFPKGHIDPGETAEQAAVREVIEETGYADVRVVCPLGDQVVDFVQPVTNRRIVRHEHFYLMELTSPRTIERHPFEYQFVPEWMDAKDAAEKLTYEAEQEWLRRAVAARR